MTRFPTAVLERLAPGTTRAVFKHSRPHLEKHTSVMTQGLEQVPGVSVIAGRDGLLQSGELVPPRMLLAIDDPWLAVVLGSLLAESDSTIQLSAEWALYPAGDWCDWLDTFGTFHHDDVRPPAWMLWWLQAIPRLTPGLSLSNWLGLAHEDCHNFGAGADASLQRRVEVLSRQLRKETAPL